MSAEPLEIPSGTVIDGRYIVETEVGRGGMAAVYRVRHAQLGTLAALKVLTVSARAVQRRLMKEGRAQAALQHPNIVSVSDVVVVGGAPGLVMEYVRGPSLDELLNQGPLSISQADNIARGVMEGVAAAHEHGLVHRDLKPANIMLAVHGNRVIPKVADFGLVKLVTGDGGGMSLSQTRSGVAMGTPAYMAPEQINDAKGVDQRADVFSLGAILYELLVGVRAFRGADLISVFTAIKDGTFTPIAQDAGVPQRMIDAIEGALQPDRGERIQDVETLSRTWNGGTHGPLSPWEPALLSQVASLGGGGASSHDALVQPIEDLVAPVPPTPVFEPRRQTMMPEAIGTAPGTVGADSWAVPAPALSEPETPLPPSVSRRWAAAAGASFLGAVLVGVGAALASRPTPLDVTIPAVVLDVVPEDDAQVLAPQRILTTRGAPVPLPSAPPPETRPESPPEPPAEPIQKTQPPPAPEPPQAAPRAPAVWVNSDVTVAFINEHGRPTPVESMQPGTYEVQAFFDVATPTSQGQHHFGTGEAWAVRCKSASMRCSVKRR